MNTSGAPARRPYDPETSGIERVLCFTAHPDDIDFGAAGTIAAWTAAGVQVSYCIMTDGDAGGFDPARDIEAITINRWPHGYGYEYNPLFDPDWPPGQAPHEIGRQRFGRITIANTDSGATAYTDVAINQAYRAVSELM